MKEQPFYIGQKVVYIGTSKKLKKNLVYIVKALDLCPKCNDWYVDVGIKDIPSGPIFVSLCLCGARSLMMQPIIWAHSMNFAPVEESFQAITFEKVMEQELTSVS